MRLPRSFFIVFGLIVVAILAGILFIMTGQTDQPPLPVSDFSAKFDSQITLTWTRPQNRDPAEIMVRQSGERFPENMEDGDLVMVLSPNKHEVSLPPPTKLPAELFFSAFTIDANKRVSLPAHLQLYCDLDGCIIVPDLSTLNAITNAGQALEVQQWVRSQLWVDGELPVGFPPGVDVIEDASFPEAVRIERLEVYMDPGLSSIIWLMYPKQANNRIMVFHAGHELPFTKHVDILRPLLAAGYLVIAVNMPLKGENTSPSPEIVEHDDLAGLPRPLHYFVEPVVIAVNYALQSGEYEHLSIMGLSGGGWTAMFAAAVDERFKAVYSIAGGYPIYIRDQIPGNQGDLEQRLPDFWDQASYLEIFILAGQKKSFVQIFNYHDPCCSQNSYALSYAPYISEIITSLGGSFEVLIDYDGDSHAISDAVLDTIIAMDLED